MGTPGMHQDDGDLPDFEKTLPSPMCDGDQSCQAAVQVIFLKTGAVMCAEHALDELNYLVARGREDQDTDKAPPDGSPTLPPLPDHT